MIRGGYYRYIRQYIDTIPIPVADEEQQKSIADLAEQCQTLAKKRYELEQTVQYRWLENLRPINNFHPLNTKLSEWWKLSSIVELAEEAHKAFKLKKSETLKVNLFNPFKQDEWEPYLKENINQWQTHTQKIQDLERQIDDLVYALFGLSDEEKKLVRRIP
jgi:hypothetical protein